MPENGLRRTRRFPQAIAKVWVSQVVGPEHRGLMSCNRGARGQNARAVKGVMGALFRNVADDTLWLTVAAYRHFDIEAVAPIE
jgi:hypothetical protein